MKKQKLTNFFNKNYKIILFLPVVVLILSLIFLVSFYNENGEPFKRDVSLSGGTTITLNGEFDSESLEKQILQQFPDTTFRKLTDLASGRQLALVIESSAEPEDLTDHITSLGFILTEENSSVEFTGESLSNSFYQQLLVALLISFISMSIVIFLLFRTAIPSMAVIFAAVSDIVITLAIVNILGVKLSAAGIAAFLMLIGYSVDTDILLTTRALKKAEGTLNRRIFNSFKTGILMTVTALAAIVPAFFIISGLPDSFRQIFLVLGIGLTVDIFVTWLTNVGIIKWYCESNGIN